jgi:hypothetical protein
MRAYAYTCKELQTAAKVAQCMRTCKVLKQYGAFIHVVRVM